MGVFKYQSTLLKELNVEGVMTPDKDGYYEVCVGALNIRNSVGAKYVLEGSKDLFNKSSALQMRVNKSGLYAENGHPVRESGMTDKEYFHRIHTIREDRACAHIKKIWLDEKITNGSKDPNERNAVAMMALIRPEGELKHVVEDAIASKDLNLCFSLRGFTRPPKGATEDMRELVNIVTWDCVILPGLSTANKSNSPSLEDLQTEAFDVELMKLEEELNAGLAQEDFTMAMEDNDLTLETVELYEPKQVTARGSMFN